MAYYQADQPSSEHLNPVYVWAAAILPSLIIGYSALIDPLLNYGLAQGFEYGGVQVGGESKSTTLTKLVVPLFMGLSLALAALSRPAVPRCLMLVVVPGALFLVLCAASAIWSADPSHTVTYSIYQSVLYFSLLISVCVARNPDRVLSNLIVMFGAVVAVNLGFAFLFHPTEIGHPGIYSHKNTLGSFGGLAALFGIYGFFARKNILRLISFFTMLGAAALVLASGSKTALGLLLLAPVLATAIYVFAKFTRSGPVVACLLIAGIAVFGFMTVGQVIDFTYEDLLYLIFGDPTFTGRTGIWQFVASHIEEAPVFGHGYRVFWSLGAASPKHASEIEFIRTIGSAHSGYYDIALDLGFVGLIILVGIILTTITVVFDFRMRPGWQSLLFLSVIFYCLGRNFMESVLFWSTQFDNLCFMLVGFLACFPVRQPVDSLHYRRNELAYDRTETTFDR
jgi:exopolysaccharide production protein ExoQ